MNSMLNEIMLEAALQNNHHVVLECLEMGADLMTRRSSGSNTLHILAEFNSFAFAGIASYCPDALLKKDKNGNTPGVILVTGAKCCPRPTRNEFKCLCDTLVKLAALSPEILALANGGRDILHGLAQTAQSEVLLDLSKTNPSILKIEGVVQTALDAGSPSSALALLKAGFC